jgi:hypothetical protein
MAKGKNVPIRYTSRDFDSIKRDLINHAKRFYPDNVGDFSQPSFNSMMLDSVAYVGDVLSYYLDYSVNESFLDTAIEYGNLRKHAKSVGFNYSGIAPTYGTITCYTLVPANSAGTAPDTSYLGVLKKGAQFQAVNGAIFTLLEDIRFDSPKNDFIASQFNKTTGATTYFAVRGYGQVSSGSLKGATVDLTDAKFKKFRRIRVGDAGITEIVKVTDSTGNQYYEVDYLTQETIYLETTNPLAKSEGVRSIVKPYVTARRFVMDQDSTGTYLQFGFGSSGDDDTGLQDPSEVVLKLHGRNHITDSSFDPNNMLGTDKLGISPVGTKLTIFYSSNNGSNNSVGVNSINQVISSKLEFEDPTSLSNSEMDFVKTSLEATNEEAITGDSAELTAEELRIRTKSVFAAQNRAVTKQDYQAISYKMPSKFGSIKRIQVIQDPNSLNRRIAMYVISQNEEGKLATTHSRTKTNLKTWITKYKALNDVLDIFDAKVLNFGIEFELAVDGRHDTSFVLNDAINRVKEKYVAVFEIGEPIYINDIWTILTKTKGVLDIKKLKVTNKASGAYSTYRVDFDKLLSKDGTIIIPPKNVIFELKLPDTDIKGVAR